MTELKHTFKVDASYHLKRKVTGIGIVIHETDKPRKNGPVIDEISELYLDIPASVTEKFAIFRALEIALERNYEIVRIRSDYNSMRRRLKEDHKMNTGHERDDLHGLILRYAKKFKEVKFLYQPRRKNQAAHRLARKAVEELMPQKVSVKDFLISDELKTGRQHKAALRPVSSRDPDGQETKKNFNPAHPT